MGINRKTSFVLVIILILYLVISFSYAENNAQSHRSYVMGTSGKSHLRTGPGLGYEDIGVLHIGETAAFLYETSTDDRGVVWYKVEFDNQICWVSSKYTTLYTKPGTVNANNASNSTRHNYSRGLVNEMENAPHNPHFYELYPDFETIDDTAPSTSTVDTENWTIADRIVTSGGDIYQVVNCNEWISARTEPDTGAEVLQRFSLGELVWVVGTWREWCLCVCDQYHEDHYICGWALSKYLNRLGYEYDEAYYAKFTNGNESITSNDDSDYDYEGGWDPGMPLGTLQVIEGDEWVEMYIHASNLTEVIAYIPPGAIVNDCYDVGDGYILCEYNGEMGFIRKEFIDNSGGKQQSVQFTVSPVIAHPVGSDIWFGSYEQDGNTSNGVEPILWKILYYSDDNTAVLITDRIIDGHSFSDSRQANYQGSELERFLTNDFYNTAFTGSEKTMIYSVDCLSASIIRNYMPTNEDRIAWPTSYASTRVNTGSYGSVNGSAMWWTSSLTADGYVNLVWANGSLQDSVLAAFCDFVGVRPSISIDMQKYISNE